MKTASQSNMKFSYSVFTFGSYDFSRPFADSGCRRMAPYASPTRHVGTEPVERSSVPGITMEKDFWSSIRLVTIPIRWNKEKCAVRVRTKRGLVQILFLLECGMGQSIETIGCILKARIDGWGFDWKGVEAKRVRLSSIV